MKRVYAIKDDDGHWYVIPYELKDKFIELDEKMGCENEVEFHQAEDYFIELFSQYMTGGDLNFIELYADI